MVVTVWTVEKPPPRIGLGRDGMANCRLRLMTIVEGKVNVTVKLLL